MWKPNTAFMGIAQNRAVGTVPLLIAALLFTALLWGCGTSTDPRPVGPGDFYRRREVSEAPLSATDRPGAVPDRATQSEPAPPAPAGVAHSEVISPAVRDTLAATTLPDIASTDAATQPSASASTEPAFEPGQYMTLGAVIAVVNGTPIYANKLLQLNGPGLRSLAKQYDQKQFEVRARNLLERTVYEQINAELEVAAAEKELDSKDKDFAKQLTTRWSERQVTDAGGSVELAKRKFLAEGRTLEEAENDEYRYLLQQLYYVRKVEPRIQVSAADERAYYAANWETEFSRPERAYTRMILCSPARHAPEGQDVTPQVEASAKTRLEDIRAKVAAGADFTELASSEATNDYRPENGGLIEIPRKGFALTNVEDAVWKLKPGEVTPVIKDRNGFYLVKLLNKEEGGTRPFDDVTVQDEIRDRLFKKQLSDLRQAENIKLRNNATLSFAPSMLDPVMEMAMQNYPRWAHGK